MSAGHGPLQTRLRSDGTIQIGEVIEQRKEALNTFLQLRETRVPDQALWIDVGETLTVEEVVPFLGELRSAVPTWNLLLITSKTRRVCDSAFRDRRQGAA